MLLNFAHRVRSFAEAMPAAWPPRYRAALAIKVKQRINGRTAYGEAMRMYAQGLLVAKLEPPFCLKRSKRRYEIQRAKYRLGNI
jgi:hypothetical protein